MVTDLPNNFISMVIIGISLGSQKTTNDSYTVWRMNFRDIFSHLDTFQMCQKDRWTDVLDGDISGWLMKFV